MVCGGAQLREHLAPGVPDRPGSATRRRQNPKAEKRVGDGTGKGLIQCGQCREDRLASQRRSPKCSKSFQVYIRRIGAKVGGRLQVGLSIVVMDSVTARVLLARGRPCCLRGSFGSRYGRLRPRGLLCEPRAQLGSLRSRGRQPKSSFGTTDDCGDIIRVHVFHYFQRGSHR